ncbi:MAG: hypothetical protein ABS808_01735 [Wolbachia endosymbiont of Polyergus mexicanus]|jgi:hypothetical protein|uniref:Uncharacterized protein n=1 Tax=Wolbachia endosymbiont of Polyergus mexicanus TaxID=3171167 RepID=A0AAU7YIW9_9RICK
MYWFNLGIGAGLVALGFTSSVAGVLTALAGSIACISFSLLVDKVIERFSSPSGSSVDSNVKVDNTPPSPSYGLPNY